MRPTTVRFPTNPGLHHVRLPVELQEGGVLVQLGLPLSSGSVQLRHLSSQSRHLGADVIHVVVVLLSNTDHECLVFVVMAFDLRSALHYLLDELLSVGTNVADSVAVNGEVRLKRFVLFQQTLKRWIQTA